MTETVILSLGCNLGNRILNMREMLSRLEKVLLPPVKASRLMGSEPVGAPEEQEWYLNQLIMGGFAGTAGELLAVCQDIEADLGRVRRRRYDNRTADIDILFFGGARISERGLTIPHPRINDRLFCLEGLCDLAPGMLMPGSGKTMNELYRSMNNAVRKQKLAFIDISRFPL